MTSLLITVFAASFVGSLHCVGMCGPFVAFYSSADGSGGLRRMISHTAYSGGRLAAYTALGVTAGSLGAALDLAGSLAGVQRSAAFVAGAVMVVWGMLALLQIRGISPFRHSRDSKLQDWLRRGFRAIGDRPPVVRAAAVGVLSGALPCGWLWAFLVTAAGTGDAAAGAAVMAAFWFGTVPALVAVGLSAQLVTTPLRRHLPTVTAALLVVLGVFAILARPGSVTAAAPGGGPTMTVGSPHACCSD